MMRRQHAELMQELGRATRRLYKNKKLKVNNEHETEYERKLKESFLYPSVTYQSGPQLGPGHLIRNSDPDI